MNNQRRKVLKNVLKDLENTRATIQMIGEEEQMSYDNMPESLLESERAMQMEENVEALEGIDSDLEVVIMNLEDLL